MKRISQTRTFELIAEDTILMTFHSQIEITKEKLLEDYLIYDDLTNNKPFYKISILNKNSITNEARLFVEQENKRRANKILGEAIITIGMKQHFFLTTYLLFQRFSFPVKTFLKLNEALQWIQQLKAKNQNKPVSTKDKSKELVS